MVIKAVFFDLFGVYLKYPNNDVSLGLIKQILKDEKLREIVFNYERGKIPLNQIPELALISHPALKYIDDWETAKVEDIVDGVDENIERAVVLLKELGYKVGLFCNNGYLTGAFKRSMIPDDVRIFDTVIESCRIGYRKSDPESYHIAARTIGCQPNECILIDDSQLNIDGAIREGMNGIYQNNEESKKAIDELERILNCRLH
ncbi:Bifunctional epoxide hydrolase 2 [Aphelenchoides besseyi]|nr:Bifunctional epoxide hydrolase 2 [Aphelenchoides besseyi]KAI6211291.1 Bifunctional epoxide hydrolase 2 [Aphelenchoides besseyi]